MAFCPITSCKFRLEESRKQLGFMVTFEQHNILSNPQVKQRCVQSVLFNDTVYKIAWVFIWNSNRWKKSGESAEREGEREWEQWINSYHVIEHLALQVGSSNWVHKNSDPLHSKMAPLWCTNYPIRFPLGEAAPPLQILDQVFLNWIDSYFVLYRYVS